MEVRGQKAGRTKETKKLIGLIIKTEPSSSAAGFKPFRFNPVNPSFQPAMSRLVIWMNMIPKSEILFDPYLRKL